MSDATSLLHALRTTDAVHDPGEANALMSAAVHEIERLEKTLAAYRQGFDKLHAEIAWLRSAESDAPRAESKDV